MRPTIAWFVVVLLHASASFASAQPTTEPVKTEPRIRRWLDVQSVHAGSRFRWYENSDDQLISSNLQWQTQLRGRFLIDRAGRYAINAFGSTGASFPSSWNNTGGGLGTWAGDLNVKQLFLAAEPVAGLQIEVGGLHFNRGEMLEHVTYDNDGFLVGERVTYRPGKGRLTQVSAAAGFFGGTDYDEVNVFKRFHRMNEFNYGQGLVAFSLHPLVSASVDYTYEDGRDIFRAGVNVRMPSTVRLLTALRFEAYQRAADENGSGFNISGEARYRRYSLTAGIMSVDEHYGSPTGRPFNADRYETGTRQYTIHAFQLTEALQLVVFQTEAFATDFPVNIQSRVDALVTFNPTAWLKRKGVF